MSLSRYYKNAPSFQAEDLVKQADKISPGWTPNPKKDQHPFRTQLVSPPIKASNPIADQGSASPQRDSFESRGASDSQPPTSEEGNNAGPLLAKDVDLDNYLDRAEAEEKATEAYRQGIEVGREKAEEDFGTAARSLLLACQQLDTLRATIIGNSSKELLDFSLAIAERILRFSVREQDHTIVATVEEALRRAVKSDEFTIHIHPDDYDSLAAKSAEIVAGLSGLNNIVVRKDPTVERGGARIESDNCMIDATIASQFEAIREEMKNKNA